MDLFLGSQDVSTCFCLRLLMSRRLLVHDFNIGKAWRARPRHGHSTNNSPHSFCVRILAPYLCFALSVDLFLVAKGSVRISA